MGTDDMTALGKLFDVFPSHRTLARSHDNVAVEVVYILVVPLHIVGVCEEHGINAELFECRRKYLVVVHKTVIEGGRQRQVALVAGVP